MRDLRGKTFDPEVIDAFFRVEQQIRDIAARFQDDADEHKFLLQPASPPAAHPGDAAPPVAPALSEPQ